ncbi:MAG: glycosyltransferase family 2 protein, partial [Candidatus Omnitrophica bacterium]|nr:glycosyltransferase family 2 protein [Candidatus Omnitrophota bacterium]
MKSERSTAGRYCVVIPAYNAAETIGPLVERVKALGFDVVVVDDGSSDATAATATQRGAVVISHVTNRGKGQALQTAFEYARRMGYDGVVTMDSDGQHDPQDIAPLIRAGEVQHAGIVVGNRMANGAGMPPTRRHTNRLMSAIVSSLVRQPIPDSQCGLRMIRREVLEGVPVRSQHFEIETELLLNAAAKRWKIVSVPVRTIYEAGQRSHIKPVRDGLRFLGLILRHLV